MSQSIVSASGTRPGARFFGQVQYDIRLWLYAMALLTLSRLGLIFLFRRLIAESSGYGTIAKALLNGMRFDSPIATWFMLPPLLVSIACLFRDWTARAGTVRRVVGIVFTFLTVLLFMITTRYFEEYNDQFNHFMFGLYYDDAGAILETIWTNYRPLSGLVFVMVSGGIATAAFLVLAKVRCGISERAVRFVSASLPRQILAGLILLALLAGAVRGSFGRRPAQKKDAGITRDEFLNKMVFNPYTALRYAVKDHSRLSGAKGLRVFLADENVRRALQLLFATDASHATVDEYLARSARGAATPAPEHVFLIVMESYEAWPMFPRFQSLGIADELLALAGKGIDVRAFVPAAGGTMESFAAIVTGLPDVGVHTNYQPTARESYPTSAGTIFRQLGYTTRVFYGGYLSWQRLPDFCRAQGFDEIYGAADMGNWLKGNEWGVDDEVLFDFIVKTVSASPRSFNVILTTSFHPPYDIDVRGKGFPLAALPAELAEVAKAPDLNMLGHFWYSDRCLGDFVRAVEAKLERPLFAITGDHAGRRSITHRPTTAERTLVPCVFYGPEVLAGVAVPEIIAGSHIDMVPTLIELCAPPGTPYFALGRDMLQPGIPPFGFGNRGMVDGAFVASASPTSQSPFERIAGILGADSPVHEPADLMPLSNALHGIAWWRIMKGPVLP